MDTPLQRKWLTMHPNRLHNLLMQKHHKDSAEAAAIVARVVEHQKDAKSKRARRTALQLLWDDVLASCRNELMNVRAMKSQARADARERNRTEDELHATQRWRALCAYEDEIMRWVDRLKRVSKAGEQTPKQFAQTLRDADKPVANDGTHWTDYVPQRARIPIIELFADLPPAKRGRSKVPFERTAPPDLRADQRAKLIKEMADDLGQAQQERAIAKHAYEIERLDALIDRINRAQYRLDNYPKKHVYPTSWQRLVD